MNCPKCKLEDVEGEDLGDNAFFLTYECPECNHSWDSSEEALSAAYEAGKNFRKYGE